jgi:hypothetical protein
MAKEMRDPVAEGYISVFMHTRPVPALKHNTAFELFDGSDDLKHLRSATVDECLKAC